jgi:hypothetical protein
MKPKWVDNHGIPEGDNGASRLVRFSVHAPPCQSSIPASAPCSWTAAVINACARMSLSSQSDANGSGESSELGWIETAPVHTTPQPPSAFTPRNLARTCGSALVIPLACGT